MDSNKKPLVSIGLPVYNGEKYIRQALDSLLTQDFKDFELIISDNGSQDHTQEICMEYAEQDKRIRYYRFNTNKGVFWNFNYVFEQSVGKYFMWASHDDYWQPSYISVCLKAYEKSPKIVLAGAFCESFDPEGKQETFIDQGLTTVGFSSFERLKKYKKVIHSGHHIGGVFYGVYKRNILSKVLPWKKVIASDHLMLAELCFQGEFITTQEKLVYKRWGGGSISLRDMARNQGVNNEFLIRFPYFVREILLQRIIFKCHNLSNLQKMELAMWSFSNYLMVNVLKMTFMKYGSYIKRAIIKCCVWKQ